MTTAIRIEAHVEVTGLLPDLVPVLEDGILARVHRSCDTHGCECCCVGHLEDEGCLVFWCAEGEHTLTFR